MAGIQIELQLEDGSYTSGMLRARQTMSDFRKELARLDPHYRKLEASGQGAFRSINRIDGESKSLLARFRDLTIVGAGVGTMFQGLMGASNGVIGNIVRLNAEMEKLKFQLAAMSTQTTRQGAMQEAGEQIRYLQEQAKSTPLSLQALTSGFVKLKVAGLDPMGGSLRAIADGVAAFGGTDESFARITLGITQMSGKGVIQMEEMRQQLGESMPAAMKLMARSMGVSIGEMTAAIGTGRVEAKAALAKWFDQVDLSFGGSADAMMQTFSGQIARLKTAFTQRVTTGEMEKAFDALKGVIGDVVTALESPAAGEFFDKVGQGMQSALAMGQRFVSVIAGMTGYFEKIGKVLPYLLGLAFAGSALKSGFAMLNALRLRGLEIAAAYNTAATSIKAMSAASLAAARANAAGNVTASIAAYQKKNNGSTVGMRDDKAFQQSTKDLGNVVALQGSTAARAGNVAKGALTGILAVGSRVLGLMGPIAMGITILGPLAFGVFKEINSWRKGAEDTTAELKNTAQAMRDITAAERESQLDEQGARQRDAMGSMAARHQAEQAEIERRYSQARVEVARYGDRPEPANQRAAAAARAAREEAHQDMMALLERQAQEMTDLMHAASEERTALVIALDEKEERERKARVATQVEESTNTVMRGTADDRLVFNKDSEALDIEYQRRLDIEIEAGRSGLAAKEWMHEERRKLEVAALEAREREYDKEIELVRDRVALGTAEQEALNLLILDRQEIQERLAETRTKTFGIDMLRAPDSPEKKMERLGRYITSTEDRVSELAAELNGASGAVSKLVYQINRGDFGNLDEGVEMLKQLRYELVEATVAQEVLNELMEGHKGVKSDIEGQVEALRERRFELEALASGELDKDSLTYDEDLTLLKIDKGFGDYGQTAEEKIMAAFRNVLGGANDVLASFGEVDRILRDQAFGQENVSRVNAMTAAVAELRDTANGLASSLEGVEFPTAEGLMTNWPAGLTSAMAMPNGTDIVSGLTARGLPDMIAKAFLLNFKDESNLNPGVEEAVPNRHGTKGYGLAQWTNERRDDLEAFARLAGKPVNDMGVQLDFLMRELTTSHKDVLDAVLKAGSVGEAAEILVRRFFKPAQEHQDRRAAEYRRADVGPALPSTPRASVSTTGQTPSDADLVGVRANMTPENNAIINGAAAATVAVEVDLGEQLRSEIDATRPLEEQQRASEYLQGQMDALQVASMRDDDPETGTAMKQLAQDILANKIYSGKNDINDPIYDDFRKAAEDTDRMTASTKEQRRALTEIRNEEEKLGEFQIEIANRVAVARATMNDPNYRPMSKELADLAEQERRVLAAYEIRYGKQSAQYKKAQDDMASYRRQLMSAEGNEALLSLKTQAEESERTAMTDRERRRAEFDLAIQALQAERDHAIKMGADKLQAEEYYQRTRLAMLKAYQLESQSGMAKQIADFSRLGDSLKAQASSWTSDLSEALYSGDPDDFDQLGRNIREGIARAFTDKAASIIMKPIMNMLEGDDGEGGAFGWMDKLVGNLMGGGKKDALSDTLSTIPGVMGGGAGGAGLLDGFFSGIKDMFSGLFGGMGGAGGGFMSWIQSFFRFGTAHKGAIIGSGFPGSVSLPAMAFANAPRYHTGGIIDGKNFGLKSNEVPMVGLKGEGVFTKDQMKHLGGTRVSNAQSISMAPVIHVNANGGTPEQNSDLAKQISSETERAMRTVVRDELIRQQRPGNMLSGRK